MLGGIQRERSQLLLSGEDRKPGNNCSGSRERPVWHMDVRGTSPPVDNKSARQFCCMEPENGHSVRVAVLGMSGSNVVNLNPDRLRPNVAGIRSRGHTVPARYCLPGALDSGRPLPSPPIFCNASTRLQALSRKLDISA